MTIPVRNIAGQLLCFASVIIGLSIGAEAVLRHRDSITWPHVVMALGFAVGGAYGLRDDKVRQAIKDAKELAPFVNRGGSA